MRKFFALVSLYWGLALGPYACWVGLKIDFYLFYYAYVHE